MRLNERPSASIRINRARKTYPAGKARDCEISVRSRRSWPVNTRGSAVNGIHIETHDLCSWLLCDNPLELVPNAMRRPSKRVLCCHRLPGEHLPGTTAP